MSHEPKNQVNRDLSALRATTFRVGPHELLVISAPLPRAQANASLSPAEQEVAAFLLEGMSYREIARARGCAERTVANHAASVYRKLGAHGRSELALFLRIGPGD